MQALIHFSYTVIVNGRKRIAELAVKQQLPAVYNETNFTDAGGLMSLGTDPLDVGRRAADYIDKLLKDAKPADMPIGSRPNLHW